MVAAPVRRFNAAYLLDRIILVLGFEHHFHVSIHFCFSRGHAGERYPPLRIHDFNEKTCDYISLYVLCGGTWNIYNVQMEVKPHSLIKFFPFFLIITHKANHILVAARKPLKLIASLSVQGASV